MIQQQFDVSDPSETVLFLQSDANITETRTVRVQGGDQIATESFQTFGVAGVVFPEVFDKTTCYRVNVQARLQRDVSVRRRTSWRIRLNGGDDGIDKAVKVITGVR